MGAAAKRILRIGHRGAAGYALENTVASFQKAIELGCDMIEVDVAKTCDDELILMHDALVDRTTVATGFVRDLRRSDVESIRTKNGERLLMLHELLDTFGGRIRLNLELKSAGTAALVGRLLKKKGIDGQIVVSSFSHEEIREFKKLNASVKAAILLGGSPADLNDLAMLIRKADADGVSLAYETVTSEVVQFLHENKYFVYVWTVNDPREIALMRSMGVDGIISDYPDRLVN